MDIIVCGKTRANVMGVKATDSNGNTVVFSAVEGAGDFAVVPLTVTNNSGENTTLSAPGYNVLNGDRVTASYPIEIEDGSAVSTTVVYPVNGYAMLHFSTDVGSLQYEVTGGVAYDSTLHTFIVDGAGTLTLNSGVK